MRIPEIPHNEEQRLISLREANVLDTEMEERYDRLTRIAQYTFSVPIALVSLLDENRQWFKSCIGLGVRETPRDISFCGHAILQKDVFVIEDAHKDERFFDNPLVTNDPYIRFYAGCPLYSSNGLALGTLCIIDASPRNFSASDRATLQDLAKLVEQELAATFSKGYDHLFEGLNRVGFFEKAILEFELCQKLKMPAAIALFEMTNIKTINKAHGCTMGDEAIANFGSWLNLAAPSASIIARFSSVTYAVFLKDSNLVDASFLVDRFNALVYQNMDKIGVDIAFRSGMADTDGLNDVSLDALLDAAEVNILTNIDGIYGA